MGGEETRVGGDYYGDVFYPRTRTETAVLRNAGYSDSGLPVQPFNKLYHISPDQGTATLVAENYSFNPQDVVAGYNGANPSTLIPNVPSIPPVETYNPVQPITTGITDSIKKPFEAVGEGLSNVFDTTKNFVTSPFRDNQVTNVPDVNIQQSNQYVPNVEEKVPSQLFPVNPSVVQDRTEEQLKHSVPQLGLGESMIGRGYIPPNKPGPQLQVTQAEPQPQPQQEVLVQAEQPMQYYLVDQAQPQYMYVEQPMTYEQQPQYVYAY